MSKPKPTRSRPPEGYRLLRDGEVIPRDRLVWASGFGPWNVSNMPAQTVGEVWTKRGGLSPVAVKIDTVATKPPATLKPLRWEPVDLIDGLYRTQYNGAWFDRLKDAETIINRLGRDNVRLKNQARKAKA
jgi:hypothetical protein